METRKDDISDWIDPPSEENPTVDEGYDEAVAAAIEEGRAQIRRGETVPLEEVKREFGTV